MEALECLGGEVCRARCERDELKARVEAQALGGMNALAKVPAFEAQLRLARDSALARTEMFEELESKLSKVGAEVIDARAEVAMSRTEAHQEMTIYSKDVADA